MQKSIGSIGICRYLHDDVSAIGKPMAPHGIGNADTSADSFCRFFLPILSADSLHEESA